jgi:hypothetical protein
MALNKENIRKLRGVIAGLPDKRFDMSVWVGRRLSNGQLFSIFGRSDELIHDCGTAGCIGGWAEALMREAKSRRRSARSWLGLTEAQEGSLFMPPGWNGDGFARSQAVAVLDHLLKTGKVDWSVAGEP